MNRHSLPGNRQRWIFPFLASTILSGSWTITCYFFSGNSLNLFLAGLFAACFTTAPLTAITGRTPGGVVTVAGIVIGLATAWLIPLHARVLTVQQLAAAAVVVLGFASAITALTSALRAFGLGPASAATLPTVIAMAWLTLPIWSSTPLAGKQISWLSSTHPIFAMNHAVLSEAMPGIWTEQQGAYGLTNFGQDVQYQMPATIWPCVMIHGLIAVIVVRTSHMAQRWFRPAGLVRQPGWNGPI